MLKKIKTIAFLLVWLILTFGLVARVKAEDKNEKARKEPFQKKPEIYSPEGGNDSVKLNLNLVDVDLVVNGMPEDFEIKRGEVIRVNANYDEHNKNEQGKPLADYRPDANKGHRILITDPNLLDAQLYLEGESIKGKWRFVFPDKIKLWMLSKNGEYKEVTSNELSEEVTLPISKDLKIEGIRGSNFTNDVLIQAVFYPEESKMFFIDQALLTVLETRFMLTFDDGPCPGKTKAIVDTLKDFYFNGERIIAGFFELGLDGSGSAEFEEWTADMGSVRNYPDIVRYVASEGHIVGNHTQHHQHFAFSSKQDVKDEITACEDEIRSALGTEPVKIFRPPYLLDNETIRETAGELGYKIIMGIKTMDSRPLKSLNDVKKTIKDFLEKHNTRRFPKLHPEPAILIFHDHSPATQYIGEIITYLQDQGFILVHFDPELVP